MELFARAVDRLGSAAAGFAAVGVLAMVAIMAVGVVFRYGVGQPLVWVDEAVRYLLVFSVLLGLAEVMRRGDNIRVDLVLESVSPQSRRMMEIAGLAAALLFGLALTWLGGEMVAFSADLGLTTAGKIDIPSAWVEAALPLGGVLLSLATVVRILRIARGDPVQEPGGHVPAGSDRE
ncbi:MAG TPA: TRAP transporter small permease [Microvirga sp.]|jgi:TRAP-type C4-dicarboxylate transport system permease small subunit|nr:TRAP transporter small permease [Microvirga sp.]